MRIHQAKGKASTGRMTIVPGLALLWAALCPAAIESSRAEQVDPTIKARRKAQTLTDVLCGSEDLTSAGIEINLGVTNIYQQNVRGGISRHRRAGRLSGSYDYEVLADLRRLLGFEDGVFYLHAEGGWPDTAGIDGPSVGSAFGVNGDAIGDRAIDLVECFYQGPLFTRSLTLMVGKIDFTAVFDTSAYANDETTQFLNGAFVNNPTIPFPDYSAGVVLNWSPTDSWYIMGGAADAQADRRETGLNTAFHDEDYFLFIFELGLQHELDCPNGPLPGTYRLGFWNDPQPKANSDGTKNYRDDAGFYATCDQMLVRENNDRDDAQGLGAFFRYGYAPSKTNDIANFWSVGFQYLGPFEGRDEDVFGVAFAQGFFSDRASTTYTNDYESAVELYYNARLSSQLNISPSIQYIAEPGGNSAVSDSVVVGVRAQMSF